MAVLQQTEEAQLPKTTASQSIGQQMDVMLGNKMVSYTVPVLYPISGAPLRSSATCFSAPALCSTLQKTSGENQQTKHETTHDNAKNGAPKHCQQVKRRPNHQLAANSKQSTKVCRQKSSCQLEGHKAARQGDME